ncbi:MAG TPA: excinuclease ABC subunit UvrC [Rectinemataceae bacterium]|nr:excinuclease ABC subunit UvrC [Rectinemataceae bacterium]
MAENEATRKGGSARKPPEAGKGRGRKGISTDEKPPAQAKPSVRDRSPARERTARFRALTKEAPESPGVYLMKDADGAIIYVGKAKVLRNRLSSYFSGRKDVKTRHLVARVESIEWIIAASEYDALILENNLIKQHTPRYNINLKDGKTYPSVRVTNEAFPRVFRTRRIVDDGSQYFGPFPSADTIDTYLEMIKRLFPLRRCVDLRKHKEACMYWHIGRCSAPCIGKISEEEYAVHVDEVRKLLSGDTEALLDSLRERMASASLGLKFEEAARLRDAIRAIDDFRGRAGTEDKDPEGRDYIAWAADGELASYIVFQMRLGRMTGRDLYRTRVASSESEALVDFLMSYYGPDRQPPAKIFVQSKGEAATLAPESGPASAADSAATDEIGDEQGEDDEARGDLDLVRAWFERQLGATTSILSPGEIPGERRHAATIALAAQNAREDLAKRRREMGDPAALAALREALGLARTPERIEGFDIAQLSGKHTVSSLVSFRNGIPDKKNYRIFKIKSLEGAIDDFASIREAVARRYTKLVNEDAELPDLVLVDGGKGQVSAAKEVLEALGLDCDLAGLAKREEEIWLPDRAEPVVLPHDSPALRVLVAVRDETHRFATGHNQRLRAAELKFGILESIEGVGPERAKKLLRVFGSLDLLGKASIEDIAEAGKLGKPVAERVKSALAAREKSLGSSAAPAAVADSILAAEPEPPWTSAEGKEARP